MNRVKLSENDIFILKDSKYPNPFYVIFLGLFVLVTFGSLWMIYWTLIETESSSKLFEVYNIQYTIPIFITVAIIIVVKILNKKINEDLKNGYKIVIKDKIILKTKDKREAYAHKGPAPHQVIAGNRMDYLIKTKDYVAKLKKEEYEKIRTGDLVLLEVAPRSKKVLNVIIKTETEDIASAQQNV